MVCACLCHTFIPAALDVFFSTLLMVSAASAALLCNRRTLAMVTQLPVVVVSATNLYTDPFIFVTLLLFVEVSPTILYIEFLISVALLMVEPVIATTIYVEP